MELLKIKSEGAWQDDGHGEDCKLLQGSGFKTMAIDHVPVKYKHDENFSTSFQIRHVVDSDGNRGFMCFVGDGMLHADTYRQGTTQEIYNEARNTGIILQQEELRRAWLNLNRR